MEKTNELTLVGLMITDLSLNHEVYGEKFYSFIIGIERNSGYLDEIPVYISERLITENLKRGCFVKLKGQYRSHNTLDGKLLLIAFAKQIEVLSEKPKKDLNEVSLDGYICKEVICRVTPLGRRQIADVLLAVNREYNKTDYIPCILWGRNAQYIEHFPLGTHLSVVGRVQSRKYAKTIRGEIVEKTAYEVSISRLEILEEE